MILLNKLFNDDKVKDSPHLWEHLKEYKFSDGSCGMRFIGTITADVNVKYVFTYNIPGASKIELLSVNGWTEIYLGNTHLNRYPVPTIIYNSTNDVMYYISVLIDADTNKIHISSRDSKNRVDHPYDIWIKYVKK
jgi:hypothetical protein